MYTFRYSDFYINLHLPGGMNVWYGGIFFQKLLPKKLFMGETFGENLWGGVQGGGTRDQIVSRKGVGGCILQ